MDLGLILLSTQCIGRNMVGSSGNGLGTESIFDTARYSKGNQYNLFENRRKLISPLIAHCRWIKRNTITKLFYRFINGYRKLWNHKSFTISLTLPSIVQTDIGRKIYITQYKE